MKALSGLVSSRVKQWMAFSITSRRGSSLESGAATKNICCLFPLFRSFIHKPSLFEQITAYLVSIVEARSAVNYRVAGCEAACGGEPHRALSQSCSLSHPLDKITTSADLEPTQPTSSSVQVRQSPEVSSLLHFVSVVVLKKWTFSELRQTFRVVHNSQLQCRKLSCMEATGECQKLSK